MVGMKSGYGFVAGNKGYRTIPQPGNPARSEAWALIEAARRMNVASELLPKTKEELDAIPLKDKQDFLNEVRLNWRLWTLFQAAWSLEDCPLPEEIRQNLFNLANFVDQQTVTILRTADPNKVQSLISINRNLAAGLTESANRAAGQDSAGTSGAENIAPRSVAESA